MANQIVTRRGKFLSVLKFSFMRGVNNLMTNFSRINKYKNFRLTCMVKSIFAADVQNSPGYNEDLYKGQINKTTTSNSLCLNCQIIYTS